MKAEKRRLVREGERYRITGVPTSSAQKMIRLGEFPRPIKIGPRAVAWIESELYEWIEKQVSKADARTPCAYRGPRKAGTTA